MSNRCGTCDKDLGDKPVCCDSCHIAMHPIEDCTGLAPSELRAVILQRRTLMFLCKSCRTAFKSAPSLLRQIEVLASEVKSLKQEMNLLKQQAKPNMEPLIFEVQDRVSRANNFMIFNAKENSSSELKIRIEADKKVVTEVMDLMGIENNTDKIVKVLRVGVQKSNKPRPLKVICSDSRLVNSVIRSKSKLYSSEFRVSSDQTKMQQDHWKAVRAELKSREENGETNLTIKYIQGVPKIVPKSNNKKNDH